MINIDDAWDNFCDGDYEIKENNIITKGIAAYFRYLRLLLKLIANLNGIGFNSTAFC